jgi:peptide-methionine (S)-S-oxide reductase
LPSQAVERIYLRMKRPILTLSAAALALAAAAAAPAATPLKTAILAGGCFWSVEKETEKLPGVVDVVVGYSGGARANPTYQNHEGHFEAVKVTYDPSKTSYAKLVDGFFRHIDPTDPGGQICDRGHSYQTAVFYADPAEKAAAEQVKANVARILGKPVATEILPAKTFWKGEAYHQDFAKRNVAHYSAYYVGCGRERKLKAVWAQARQPKAGGA